MWSVQGWMQGSWPNIHENRVFLIDDIHGIILLQIDLVLFLIIVYLVFLFDVDYTMKFMIKTSSLVLRKSVGQRSMFR